MLPPFLLAWKMKKEDIIKLLDLKPHIEGGYFRETYRAAETIPSRALPERYEGERNFSTAIYYLLTSETRSELHRLKSDEIFHFYIGDPVLMLLLFPDGSSKTAILGTDLKTGQTPQLIVPKNTWMGGMLVEGGKFALLGTTVAPGFDFRDFELGKRKELLQKYPSRKELIIKLTSR